MSATEKAADMLSAGGDDEAMARGVSSPVK